jgi:hypothetical protein
MLKKNFERESKLEMNYVNICSFFGFDYADDELYDCSKYSQMKKMRMKEERDAWIID